MPDSITVSMKTSAEAAPPEYTAALKAIKGRLSLLRWTIRAYLLGQSLLGFCILAGGFFWISLLLDRQFHFSREIRAVLLMVAAAAGVAALWRWTLRLVFRQLWDRQMALVFERSYPKLKEALLTAVELAVQRATPGENGRPTGVYYEQLLRRTIDLATQFLPELTLRKIFRLAPLARIGGLALVAIGSWAAAAQVWPADYAIWTKRWFGLKEIPWPTQTGLVLQGFYRGKALVAKGETAEIRAAVDTTMPLVPRNVRVRFWGPAGVVRRAMMIREGLAPSATTQFQRFYWSVGPLLDPVELEITGGDRTIRGLKVEVVDRPLLTEVLLDCMFPRYIGKSPQRLPLRGSVEVAQGSQLVLIARANKQLVWVEIDRGKERLEITDEFWRQVIEIQKSQEAVFERYLQGESPQKLVNLQAEIARRLGDLRKPNEGSISGMQNTRSAERVDRNQFVRTPGDAVYWHHLAKAGERAEQLSKVLGGDPLAVESEIDRGGESEIFPVIQLSTLPSDGGALRPVAVAYSFCEILGYLEHAAELRAEEAGFTEFRCDLGVLEEPVELAVTIQDVHRIQGAEPARLVISPRADAPPKLAVELRGIGSVISPQAKVRFVGQVEDDYGIREVWLESAKDAGPERRKQLAGFSQPLERYELESSFEVAELDATPGEKLTLKLLASDFCDLREEINRGSTPPWILEVVTPEQLRLALERQELLLRQQLDQIVRELEQTRDLWAGLSEEISRVETPPSQTEQSDGAGGETSATAPRNPADMDQSAIRRTKDRVLQNLEKSAQETQAIVGAVDHLCEQIVNNRLEASAWLERLQTRVRPPLERALSEALPQAKQAAEGLSQNLSEDRQRLREAHREGLQAQQQAIALLLQSRQAMLELEDLKRVLEVLRAVIESQEQLLDATRERQRQRLRELFGERPR